jgi:hypothetical protein
MHPDIFSLPETDFFGRLFGNRIWTLLGAAGLVRGKAAMRALAHLSRVTERSIERPDWKPLMSTTETVAQFIELMDRLADEQECSAWIEKTPKHFRYIPQIVSYIPDAQFLHVVREGRAAVASIRDRAQKYPDAFGHQKDPRYGIRLWNAAVRRAANRCARAKDQFIFYEDFCKDPERVLRHTCTLWGLTYYSRMLSDQGTAKSIVRPEEDWKSDVARSIKPATSKFEEVFSESEKAFVEKHLDWATYEWLRHCVEARETRHA